jgi:hypothetical protein
MPRRPHLYPHVTLWNNLEEVARLLEIHTKMSGKGPGYKHNVEVLNKSGIVLLVACWESFVEDTVETAFSILLRRAKKHDLFAIRVLTDAARPLKDSKDERAVWNLAGDGWKSVLKEHKSTLLEKYIGKLNTPRPSQVDVIYESLLGIKSVSSHWHWQHTTADSTRNKLDDLIDLRGSIAHRVKASHKIGKNGVRDYVEFINRIAVITSNVVRSLVLEKTGKEPWPEFQYKGEERS